MICPRHHTRRLKQPKILSTLVSANRYHMINKFKKPRTCKIDFFFRPGQTWSTDQLNHYCDELEDIAEDCFRQVPRYQCLCRSRTELERNVITIARDGHGKAVGFCSAVILDIDGYRNVLHLGLTCVKKEARSLGLTHLLTSKLLMNYLIRTSLFRPVWITNVACVLSSLGNIALHFENVFPSPFGKSTPSADHIRIAIGLDRLYRSPIAINEASVFDKKHFVFRGSVDNTVFKKSARDIRYHHRNADLTQFYLKRLNFKNGDEVVQVGQISLFSYPKYLIKMTYIGIVKLTTAPIQRLKTNLFSRKS